MFSFPCIILQFLLLLSTSYSASSSSTSNATTIYEVLREHGLPMGLFPKGVTNFNVSDDGRFWVHLDQACNAKFENELHYDRNVTGSLSYGKIDSLSGMKAQDLFLWLSVMSIHVDVPPSGLIYFKVGVDVEKKLASSLFETPPDCVAVRSENADVVDVYKGQYGRLRYQHEPGTSGRDVL